MIEDVTVSCREFCIFVKDVVLFEGIYDSFSSYVIIFHIIVMVGGARGRQNVEKAHTYRPCILPPFEYHCDLRCQQN